MTPRFADVALPVPPDRLFTYEIPPELRPLAQRGVRVLVPFGARTLTGFIVGFRESPTVEHVKMIRDILDDAPVFLPELISLTEWVARYYMASWGEVLKAAVPQGMAMESRRTVRLARPPDNEALRSVTSVGRKIIKALSSGKEMSLRTLAQQTANRHIHAAIHKLSRQGIVEIVERPLTLKAKPKIEQYVELDEQNAEVADGLLNTLPPRQRLMRRALDEIRSRLGRGEREIRARDFLASVNAPASILGKLEALSALRLALREVAREFENAYSYALQTFTLNSHQQSAVDAIAGSLDEGSFTSFLLFGVTGSGKTQVYIEAVRHAVGRGKGAIILVPEISLTTQIVARFRAEFGNEVGVFHSRMSVGERYDTWRLAHTGRYRIVIGPRSAVFAPLPNLGLIIVDEEQEAAYKSFDSSPRYHARDVALMRGKLASAVVVLGSATPSLETYHNAVIGRHRLLELPERVDRAQLPTVEIIDMRKEWRTGAPLSKGRKAEGEQFLSARLRGEIESRIARGEGVILLQNRRGFSHFVECMDCGYVELCENCRVSLTYHAPQKHLRCHYCGFVKPVASVCPQCGGVQLRFRGAGTQRIEEELAASFPSARTLRMDLDTTSRKGSHAKMLKQFADGTIDILLGTQMVAKGLDFSRVTLVGVVSADTQMLLPDFRAAERTFQLLTQVAGRAGRSTLAGRVLVQTHRPDHPCLNFVVGHDYRKFFEMEINERRDAFYPPFSRLALIELKGESEERVIERAESVAGALSKASRSVQVLGPAPAAIARVRNQYRYHILLKTSRAGDPNGSELHSAIQAALTAYHGSHPGPPGDVRISVDVDPQGMM